MFTVTTILTPTFLGVKTEVQFVVEVDTTYRTATAQLNERFDKLFALTIPGSDIAYVETRVLPMLQTLLSPYLPTENCHGARLACATEMVMVVEFDFDGWS